MKRLATLCLLVPLAAPAAFAQINANRTPGNQPEVVSGTTLRFYVDAATSFGQGASIELHPQGTGTYNRFACYYQEGSTSEGAYNFVCDIPSGTLNGDYSNATVEYQYLVSDYGNPHSNTFGFTGFNYTYQSTEGNLPVELVSLTATASGTTALVRWTTASETNNAAFSLERRLASGTWTAVATVAGRGTTAERTDYAQPVAGLAAGRHTFRLTQRDLDGTSTIVGTVEVAIAPDGAVAISERRVGSAVVLGVTPRAAQALRVEAFDVTGRRVATLLDGVVDATAEVTLDRATLAAGVYVVRVSGAGVAAARTVVVR